MRCKATLYPQGRGRPGSCSREAKKDGWCTQHHPDVAKARREALEAQEAARHRARTHRMVEATLRDRIVAAALGAPEDQLPEPVRTAVANLRTHQAQGNDSAPA